jgi:hypothetical protein
MGVRCLHVNIAPGDGETMRQGIAYQEQMSTAYKRFKLRQNSTKRWISINNVRWFVKRSATFMFTLPPIMFSFNLRGKSDLYDPLEGSSRKWLQENGNLRTTIGLVLIFLIPFFFNYAVAWIMYHWQHWKVEEKQIPPEYPSFIPYLGSIIPLLLNGQNFLQHAT